MSKILFINLSSHGHINPTLGVAKELIEKGNEVTYLLPENFREKVESIGAKFKSYNSSLDLSKITFLDGSKDLILNYLKTFEELIKIILNSREKYDCIVYDQLLAAVELIGKKLNIPTVCSITTFVFNENYLERVSGSALSKMDSLLLNDNEIKTITNRLYDQYKIKIIPSLTKLLMTKGTANLVFTSRYFQPFSEMFDDDYKFIGASISPRKEQSDLSQIINDKNGKKKVYISLGTIYNNSIEFYKKCFEAFKDFDFDFILSVGQKIKVEELGTIPKNFSVHNYVPQLEVLSKVDVFISHGGMNSINEALFFGIPSILIPQSVDQPFVAYRVSELDAGIVLNKDKITPNLLKESLEKILINNHYKKNSQNIGQSLKDAGGYKMAAYHIENIINKELHIS